MTNLPSIGFKKSVDQKLIPTEKEFSEKRKIHDALLKQALGIDPLVPPTRCQSCGH